MEGNRKSITTLAAFPNDDGVVIDGRFRFLKFSAFERLGQPLGWKDLRKLIDELLQARLLRQGLLLDCEECGGLSFVSIDDVRQDLRCDRCGASPISQTR